MTSKVIPAIKILYADSMSINIALRLVVTWHLVYWLVNASVRPGLLLLKCSYRDFFRAKLNTFECKGKISANKSEISAFFHLLDVTPLQAEFCPSVDRRPGMKSADLTVEAPPAAYAAHHYFGDRSFTIAGPRTWNNLPDAIRDSSLSFLIFAKLLKSYLFVWLPRRLWY